MGLSGHGLLRIFSIAEEILYAMQRGEGTITRQTIIGEKRRKEKETSRRKRDQSGRTGPDRKTDLANLRWNCTALETHVASERSSEDRGGYKVWETVSQGDRMWP